MYSGNKAPTHETNHFENLSWSQYKESIKHFRDSKILSDPGYFAKSSAQQHYEQCLSCPLTNKIISGMPVLTLPLKINVIRSPVLGCSSDLNNETIQSVVDKTNRFWEQARIRFDLLSVQDCTCYLPLDMQNEIHHFLTRAVQRGQDRNANRKARKRIKYLDLLLSSFSHIENLGTYNIWFMDMVGHQYQGMCIDRKTHTVIMGERSTKGYSTLTKRPHECLAKTAAHELGHALTLNHPKNKIFEDGTDQILTGNKKNLMTGGRDVIGGGGDHLEQWQISKARLSAEEFLSK